MLDFYIGKKVLITGHTGFKGTWLTKILVNAGAKVLGYSRCSEKFPSLFKLSDVEKDIIHIKGDIRDYAHLRSIFSDFQPELVFHLAAQPIVRESYLNPLETYETNIMGTANVLEAIRQTSSVKSAVIVTTDKVYRNNEWSWGYRENDVLDGFDPYSNSKSCAELITASYRRSFSNLPPVSTVRAGNVIGGGDFAKDRIIPDCVRAMQRGEPIIVRNPYSVRPYQHVLEPLFAYLLIAKRQEEVQSLAGCYNIGPDDCDCLTTGELVTLFCNKWGNRANWIDKSDPNAPHEADFLKLDCTLMKKVFNWKPKWHIETCMDQIIQFSKLWLNDKCIVREMNEEIQRYLS